TGEVIGACGNTGIHRRCDAAFLEWCNEQGGDVSACDDKAAFAASASVPCGTGPNAIVCDLPFKDNCDSLDGTFVCFTEDCTVGACSGTNKERCAIGTVCPNGLHISCATPGDSDTESCSKGVSNGKPFVSCLWKDNSGSDQGQTIFCD
ncbi:MAG: hypothetical protein D6705_17070, partial [Deltaproteobacteria bacterium]